MSKSAIWIKVATDTFQDPKIQVIEAMPGGQAMVLIWIKILLLAGTCNAGGYLKLQDDIPFTSETLVAILKQDISSIDSALNEFARYKMIIRTEEGICITNFNKYQDLDKLDQKRAKDRERKEKQRKKEKQETEAEAEDMDTEEAAYDVQMSQGNGCDIERDTGRDSSYSTSASTSESDISSSLYKDNSNYIEFYNNNFHQATKYEADVLRGYEKSGMRPEVITLALKETLENNNRELRYTKKILQRWLKNNILTEEAVLADKAEHESKKNSAKDTSRKSNSKPSTFNDYSQREYDYEALESKLLGWDKINQYA